MLTWCKGEDISKGKDGGTRKVIVKHGDSPDTPHEGAICTGWYFH